MRIVLALDSFKGSLSAVEACGAAARGIRSALPGAEVVEIPMADGGEGTARTILAGRGGEWIEQDVTGPLPGRRVRAGWAWLPGAGPAAVVEMAVASGLHLLEPGELDPLSATTFGTGELLASALARAPATVWLAIGGSATVDGGVGAARALGWRFLDGRGREVRWGGGELERIRRIAAPEGWSGPPAPVQVLCDVANPLLGPRGAARIYGPQKGATYEEVVRLEAGLANLADVIEAELGQDVREVPGAGAAGGLGAGALAFLDAELVSGIEAVMEATGLHEALAGADWVVTGEGRLDEQSLEGKVVSGVAGAARQAGCRVAVLAGSVDVDRGVARRAGVEHAVSATPEGMPPEEAMTRAAELVEETARRLGERLVVGSGG